MLTGSHDEEENTAWESALAMAAAQEGMGSPINTKKHLCLPPSPGLRPESEERDGHTTSMHDAVVRAGISCGLRDLSPKGLHAGA